MIAKDRSATMSSIDSFRHCTKQWCTLLYGTQLYVFYYRILLITLYYYLFYQKNPIKVDRRCRRGMGACRALLDSSTVTWVFFRWVLVRWFISHPAYFEIRYIADKMMILQTPHKNPPHCLEMYISPSPSSQQLHNLSNFPTCNKIFHAICIWKKALVFC